MPVALVVEDDENIRLLYREALQRAGFTLLDAASVRDAIKILDVNTPAIVFVDMNLPEHPGTEVLAYIKETPRLAATKTVVVTANPQSDGRAAEFNVDLFMVKPVPIAEMMRLAQRLVGMKTEQ